MTMWERLTTILKREASDVKDGLSLVGRTLDEELARKERELEASPGERLDMILEDIETDDERFREIEAAVTDRPPPTTGSRQEPKHQLLDAADVSDSARLDEALALVSVVFEPMVSGEPAHTHTVAVDESPWHETPLDYDTIAAAIADHVLVSSATPSTGTTIAVHAETLHVDDVRLLAAAAVVPQLPTL